ncbi:MAG: protein kinase, partial [Pseudomonadota bacterium]
MTQATDSLDPSGPRTLAAGTVVGGRFRIEGLLSREAGTHVYRASDNRGEGLAAVRVIPIGAIAHGPARLLSELDRTTSIHHKNLVDVLAVGREADFLFVASELVDGQTLREFIDGKRAEGRGVSLKGACNLVAHVANAIENAGGMAHGALTPACIWVNRAGRVKVGGLGLGWALPGLARIGTAEGASDLAYAAPEILGGAAPSSQSDVHALGAILYELLTGRSPAPPRVPVSSVLAGIPKGVDDVIEAALVRSPERRWSSTRELKESMQAAAVPALDGGATVAASTTNGADAATAAGGQAVPAARATAALQVASDPVATVPSGGPTLAAPPTTAPPPGRASIPPGAGLVSPFATAPVPGSALGGAATPLRPAAPPAQVSASGRQTLGRSFDVGAAAGAAADDTQERWLVQKDKLDFGPFSLVQIRAQIERGDILPEHIIVDSDSGSRC